jgi:hypothetical protein
VTRLEDGRLRLTYERGTFARTTLISSTEPARLDRRGLTFKVRLAPHGMWSTDLDVVTAAVSAGEGYARPKMALAQGAAGHGGEPAAVARRRSSPRVRLGSAEGHVPAQPRRPRRPALLAAGRGRSEPAGGRAALVHDDVRPRQHLDEPADAAPSRGACGDDAARPRRVAGNPGRRLPGRGSRTDPSRDALRRADGVRGAAALAVLRKRGRDAALRRAARRVRALDRRPEPGAGARARGSRRREPVLGRTPGTRSHRDGRLPGFPRATCELQGYAYDAKRRGSRLAREIWKDPALADELERQAADLKRRFNRDFWVADDEYFALALDRDGVQLDTLASNNGHLLWSGIVDKSKAKAVVRHLMGPTALLQLGREDARGGRGALQPDRVPHRNGVAVRQLVHRLGAAELRLQGRRGADRLGHPRGRGVLRRSPAGGVRRLRTRADEVPGGDPTACSPQAWSTGTPFLLIRTMLGLEPVGEHLVVDPALSVEIGRLELLDIPGRWGRVDAFGRGRVEVGAGPRRRRSPRARD